MLKERFIVVAELIKNGTIVILSRGVDNVAQVKVPKSLWMQMTVEDLVRGIQAKLTETFYHEVQYEIFHEQESDVIITIKL